MSAPVGFVLVTHHQPEQTAFLCRKLSQMFDHPPIVIHHDYSQSPLDPSTLPPQVRVVKDWVKTSWGASSVIDAYLAALRLLHEGNGPDWTMNLSSADYPIRSPEGILHDLQTASVDAFLDFREITHGLVQPSDAHSHAMAFQRPTYLRLARKRYLAFKYATPFKTEGQPGAHFFVQGPWVTRLFTPFSAEFRPFAGDWWHAVNRRAAGVLLHSTRQSAALRRFYAQRECVEESYMHTVLLNAPGLRIANNNLRYTIWPVGAPHPKLLDVADVPELVGSGAHFARKFPFDEALYQAVDTAVLGHGATPAASPL